MDPELRDRLVRMETSFSNFKETHHAEAGNRHSENTKKLDKIFKWLENLPCKADGARLDGVEVRVAQLYFIVVIVVIVGVVLGIWVKALTS